MPSNETLKQYSIEVEVNTKKALDELDKLQKKVDKGVNSGAINKDLQEEINDIKREIHDLSTSVSKDTDSIKNKLSSSLSGINTSTLKTKLKDVNNSINNVREKIEELSNAFNKNNFTKFEKFIETLSAPLGELNKTVSSLNTTLTSLIKPLETISSIKLGSNEIKDFGKAFESLNPITKKASKQIIGSLEELNNVLTNTKILDPKKGLIQGFDDVEKESATRIKQMYSTIMSDVKLLSKQYSFNFNDLLSEAGFAIDESALKSIADRLTNIVNEALPQKERKSKAATLTTDVKLSANIDDDEVDKLVDNLKNTIETKVQSKLTDKIAIKVPIKGDTTGIRKEIEGSIRTFNNEAKTDPSLKVDIPIKAFIDEDSMKMLRSRLQSEINEGEGLTLNGSTNIAGIEGISSDVSAIRSILSNGIPISGIASGGELALKTGNIILEGNSSGSQRIKDFGWLFNHQLKEPGVQKMMSEFSAKYDLATEAEKGFKNIIDSIVNYFTGKTDKSPLEALKNNPLYKYTTTDEKYAKHGGGKLTGEYQKELEDLVKTISDGLTKEIDEIKSRFGNLSKSLTDESKQTVVDEINAQLKEATSTSSINSFLGYKDENGNLVNQKLIEDYRNKQRENAEKEIQSLEERRSYLIEQSKIEQDILSKNEELLRIEKLNEEIRKNDNYIKEIPLKSQNKEWVKSQLKNGLKTTDINELKNIGITLRQERDQIISALSEDILAKYKEVQGSTNALNKTNSRIQFLKETPGLSVEEIAKQLITKQFTDALSKVDTTKRMTDYIRDWLNKAMERAITDATKDAASGKDSELYKQRDWYRRAANSYKENIGSSDNKVLNKTLEEQFKISNSNGIPLSSKLDKASFQELSKMFANTLDYGTSLTKAGKIINSMADEADKANAVYQFMKQIDIQTEETLEKYEAQRSVLEQIRQLQADTTKDHSEEINNLMSNDITKKLMTDKNGVIQSVEDAFVDLDNIIKIIAKNANIAKRELGTSVYSSIGSEKNYEKKKNQYASETAELKRLSGYGAYGETLTNTERDRFEYLKRNVKSLREEISLYEDINNIQERTVATAKDRAFQEERNKNIISDEAQYLVYGFSPEGQKAYNEISRTSKTDYAGNSVEQLTELYQKNDIVIQDLTQTLEKYKDVETMASEEAKAQVQERIRYLELEKEKILEKIKTETERATKSNGEYSFDPKYLNSKVEAIDKDIEYLKTGTAEANKELERKRAELEKITAEISAFESEKMSSIFGIKNPEEAQQILSLYERIIEASNNYNEAKKNFNYNNFVDSVGGAGVSETDYRETLQYLDDSKTKLEELHEELQNFVKDTGNTKLLKAFGQLDSEGRLGFSDELSKYMEMLSKRNTLQRGVDWLTKTNEDENGNALSYEEKTRRRLVETYSNEKELVASTLQLQLEKKNLISEELSKREKEIQDREQILSVNVDKERKNANKDFEKNNTKIDKQLDKEYKNKEKYAAKVDEINNKHKESIELAKQELEIREKELQSAQTAAQKAASQPVNNLNKRNAGARNKAAIKRQLGLEELNENVNRAQQLVDKAKKQVELEEQAKQAELDRSKALDKIAEADKNIISLEVQRNENEQKRAERIKELNAIEEQQRQLKAQEKDEKKPTSDKTQIISKISERAAQETAKAEERAALEKLELIKQIEQVEEQLQKATGKEREELEKTLQELRKKYVEELNIQEIQKQQKENAKQKPLAQKQEAEKEERKALKAGTVTDASGNVIRNIALGDIATETTLQKVLAVLTGGKVPTPGTTGEKTKGGVTLSEDYKALRKQFTDTKNLDILKEMFIKFPKETFSQYRLKPNKSELGYNYVSANGKKATDEANAFTIQQMEKWGVSLEQLTQNIKDVGEESEKTSTTSKENATSKKEEAEATNEASKASKDHAMSLKTMQEKLEASTKPTGKNDASYMGRLNTIGGKPLSPDAFDALAKEGIANGFIAHRGRNNSLQFKQPWQSGITDKDIALTNEYLSAKQKLTREILESEKAQHREAAAQRKNTEEAKAGAEAAKQRKEATKQFVDELLKGRKKTKEYSFDDIKEKGLRSKEVKAEIASRGWEARGNQETGYVVKLAEAWKNAAAAERDYFSTSKKTLEKWSGEGDEKATDELTRRAQKKKENAKASRESAQAEKEETVAVKENTQAINEEGSAAEATGEKVEKATKKKKSSKKEAAGTSQEAVTAEREETAAVEANTQAIIAEGDAVEATTKKKKRSKGKENTNTATPESSISTLPNNIQDIIKQYQVVLELNNRIANSVNSGSEDMKQYLLNTSKYLMDLEEQWVKLGYILTEQKGKTGFEEIDGEKFFPVKKFTAGILEDTPELIKVITEVAKIPEEVTREVLQIHSPSEVFKQLGFWTDQGLAEGILKNADLVRNAIINMLKQGQVSPEQVQELIGWNKDDGTLGLGKGKSVIRKNSKLYGSFQAGVQSALDTDPALTSYLNLGNLKEVYSTLEKCLVARRELVEQGRGSFEYDQRILEINKMLSETLVDVQKYKGVEGRNILNMYGEQKTHLTQDADGNSHTVGHFSFDEQLLDGRIQRVLVKFNEETEQWEEQLISVETSFKKIENRLLALDKEYVKALGSGDTDKIASVSIERDKYASLLQFYSQSKEFAYDIYQFEEKRKQTLKELFDIYNRKNHEQAEKAREKEQEENAKKVAKLYEEQLSTWKQIKEISEQMARLNTSTSEGDRLKSYELERQKNELLEILNLKTRELKLNDENFDAEKNRADMAAITDKVKNEYAISDAYKKDAEKIKTDAAQIREEEKKRREEEKERVRTEREAAKEIENLTKQQIEAYKELWDIRKKIATLDPQKDANQIAALKDLENARKYLYEGLTNTLSKLDPAGARDRRHQMFEIGKEAQSQIGTIKGRQADIEERELLSQLNAAWKEVIASKKRYYDLSRNANISTDTLNDEKQKADEAVKAFEKLKAQYNKTFDASDDPLRKLFDHINKDTVSIVKKYSEELIKLKPTEFAAILDELQKLPSIFSAKTPDGIQAFIDKTLDLQNRLKSLAGLLDSDSKGKFDLGEKLFGRMDNAGFLNNKIPLFKDELEKLKTDWNNLWSNWQGTKDQKDALNEIIDRLQILKATATDYKDTMGKMSFININPGQIDDIYKLRDAMQQYAENLNYSKISFQKFDENQNHLIMNARNANGELVQLAGAFNRVTGAAYASQPTIKQSGMFFNQLGATLKQSFSTFGYYLGFAAIIRRTMREFRQGLTTLKEFDSALTTISYTMKLSQKELKELGNSAIDMADDLSLSMQNALKIYQIYANMQTSAEEIQKVAKPTAILSNLSGVDASAAADQVQGVIEQFNLLKDGEEDLAETSMHIVDVFDKISANVKIDYAKGIGTMSEAVTAAGQVAHDAGMSFEELAAITAKVAERTREDGSTIGNALKTMLVRISKVSKMPEYADEVDNETLSKASKALHDIGIEVYAANGEFNNITDTLTQLNEKWDSLNDVQKSNIAFQIAATRQSAKFKSMLEAWTDAMQLANEATNANGNALENQEKYEESYAGKLQRLQTEWQEFWLNLLNSDGFKKLIEALTTIVKWLNNVGDSIGHLTVVISGLALASVLSTAIKIGKQTIINTLSLRALGKEAATAAGKITSVAVAEEAAAKGARDMTTANTAAAGSNAIRTGANTVAGVSAAGSGAASAGIGAGATAALGWLAAIVAAGYAAYKIYDHFNISVDEATDYMEEWNNTLSENENKFQSQKELIDKAKKSYADLAKGVNTLNNTNINLSDEEYAEFISLNNQLAEQFPELRTGIDEEGNAILNLGDNALITSSKLDEIIKRQEQIKNTAIEEAIPDTFKNTKAFIDDAETYSKELNVVKARQDEFVKYLGNGELSLDNKKALTGANQIIYNLLNEAVKETGLMEKVTADGINIFDGLGISGGYSVNLEKLTPEEKKKLQDAINKRISTARDFVEKSTNELTDKKHKAKINWNSFILDNILPVLHTNNGVYDALSNEGKALADLVIGGLSEGTADAMEKYGDPIKYIEDMILPNLKDLEKQSFTSLNGENLSIFDLFSGELSNDDLINLYDQIQQYFSEHDIELKFTVGEDAKQTDKEFNDNLLQIASNGQNLSERGYETSRKVDTTKSKQALEYLRDYTKKFTKDQKDLWNKVTIGAESAEVAVQRYVDKLAEVEKEVESITNQPLSKSEMIDAISEMTTGFDKLDEIYADIYDKGSFDFTKLASKGFTEAFEGLETEYTEFIEAVSANPDNLKGAQNAFNKLAGAYIEHKGILKGLSEETKELTANMLKNMGIANAEEIVTKELQKQQTQLAVEKDYTTKYTKELADATADEIDALADEKQYSEETRKELNLLALKKQLCNDNPLDTTADIANLIRFISNLGLACDALQAYYDYKRNVESEGIASDSGDLKSRGFYSSFGQNTQKKFESGELARESLNAIIKRMENSYDYSYEGADKTRDAIDKANKSGEESKEIIDWIEKAIQRMEEEINRIDKTVSATYKNWSDRNNAIKSEISAITKEISMQQQAYEAYMRDAAAIPLAEEYKKLVREGAMYAETITDKNLKKLIDQYTELYEKAIKAQDAIIDLNAKIAALAKQKFDNVKSEFEGFTSEIDHFIKMINQELSHVEAMGKIAGKSFYEAQIGQDEKKLEELKKEREALTNALAEAEANGIEKGSADWIAMRNEIYSVEEEIQQLGFELEELKQKLIEVDVKVFDDLKRQFDDYISSIDHFRSMTDKQMSHVENMGGIAGKSFYKEQINQNDDKLEALKKEREKLMKQLEEAEKDGLEKGSPDWIKMRDAIYAIDEQIVDTEYETEELKKKMKEVAKLDFDDLKSQFEQITQIIQNQVNTTNSVISLIEKSGHVVSTKYYKNLIKMNNQNISTLRKEYETLQDKLAKAMKKGDIKKYSDEWYEMTGNIEEVKQKILESAEATVEYANAIRQIKWDLFDRGVNGVSNLISETEFLIEMLQDDMFDEKTGKMTTKGLAAQGLMVSEYQAYKTEASKYAKEISKVREELEADPKNTTLIERYNELLAAQREAIKNSEEQKKKIQELYKEGYDKLINSLQKLIDEYKKASDSAKELHDYQETINEKTSAVNKIQKQILAYSNGDTEENRATLQKLSEDLKNAQKDLEETEREKSKRDQEELLNNFMDDLQEWADERLNNIDKLLNEAIKTTNANREIINNTIQTEAYDIGLTTSTEFEKLWSKQGPIISSTNGTVKEIFTTAQKLPTQEWEKGELEGLFGDNSDFIIKLTTIKTNTKETTKAINRTKTAIGNVESRVKEFKKENIKRIDDGIKDLEDIDADIVEYSGNLGTKIEGVQEAVENLELSVTVNVEGGGSTEITQPGTPDTPSTPDKPDNPDSPDKPDKPEPDVHYFVTGTVKTPYGGTQSLRKDNLTLQQAQAILEEWKQKYNKNGYSFTGNVNHYAKGGIIGKDSSFLDAIAELLGEDHMIAAKEGERVLTESQNKNFEKMVSANFTPLNGDYSSILADKMIESLSQVPLANIGATSNVGNTTTVGDINITLPNVTDKQDFINWLKNDGQIEKIITAMTVGRMTGGNSYAKMKY